MPNAKRIRHRLAKLGTIASVAGALEVSENKVRQLVDDGQLPSLLLGKSRRIPWDAVDSLIESRLSATEQGA